MFYTWDVNDGRYRSISKKLCMSGIAGFETINNFQENDLFSLVYLRSCAPFEPLSSWLAFVSNNISQVG